MARDRRDDYDDEDDTPRRRRRDDDDGDDDREERPSRRRRDEEDEEPAPRRRSSRDDDEDDRPRRRTARGGGGSSGGTQTNVCGLISLIVGIPSILVNLGQFFSCCCVVVGWVPATLSIVGGVSGLILGIVGLSLAKKSDGRMGGGLAVAGTILNGIALVVALLLLILFLTIWSVALSQPTTPFAIPTAGTAGGTGGPVSADGPADVNLSVDAMWMEFNDDPAGADVKYMGKVVQVTGVIDRGSPGGTALNAEVRLKVSGGRSYVTCGFGPNRQAAVAGLTAGQTVTIRGRYDSHSPSGPNLKDCIVMPGAGGGGAGVGAGGLKVTASVLAKEYVNNAVAANARYTDKMLEVTGTVVSIDRADPKVTKVNLGTGGKKEVECQVEAKDAGGLVGVRNGQQVTLRGKCVGNDDNIAYVTVEECTVVK